MSPDRQRTSGAPRGAGPLLFLRGGSARGRLLIVSAAIWSLLFGVAAYGLLIHRIASPGWSTSKGMARSSGDVQLGGHAAGLYPGHAERLWVHVDNLSRYPRAVRSVEVVAGNARPHCSARNVSVSAYRGRLRLPPYGRRWIALTIAMRPEAANACQHAVFPLTFRAEVGR